MPYIHEDARKVVDREMENLAVAVILKFKPEERSAVLTYVITRILGLTLIPKGSKFEDYNKAVGVLESTKLELYRSQIGVYEEKKRKENGDIKYED